ncbi:MAG: hypothetical protein A3J58_02370 [Candidatus Sungbacteria bacterium RIFCSPHIGHO2_02_FULL_52_23]|uniref:HIT domain-containing protein n=1 Tax=Candidatus Sungbacteria bacterium RIFCSPHIGHO2_02_FULL_52_23 TaxID=1802274 RepID=A0A1G2KWN0_9BACT|nr:MAG: hypothetical protein A3J58_02370 [Candidatus Sungbacteria bacterium RIFCSPHIGHO2_02_FULL_52_23]
MACPFCEVNEQRHPILEKRDHVYIMPSNPRLVYGHLLIIPIRHIERPTDLRTDEQYELFDTVIELQEKILTLKPGMGCDVRQHSRPFLPESNVKVDHIHWHLLPRELDDELYLRTQIFERDVFRMLSSEEMQQEAQRLRQLFMF